MCNDYRKTFRSTAWSPTISLSWLWGLGFFYSIHVMVEDGWLGFILFVVPNCLGLLVFGWVMGSDNIDPDRILSRLQTKYISSFIITQVLALAITIFALAEYLWRPFFPSSNMWVPLGLLIVGGCAIGHASTIVMLKRMHVLFLITGIGAGLYVLMSLQSAAPLPDFSTHYVSSKFLGLIFPILVGFLLGPWADLQQWQRVVEIRREGGSVRIAYGAGTVLFFFLLLLNGLLASSGAEVGGSAGTFNNAAEKGQTVAIAIAAMSAPGARAAFIVWAMVAAVTTIDSSYVATGWILKRTTFKSSSPLLAFISPKAVSSPVWIILLALLLAIIAINNNFPLVYLMAPFATILAGVVVLQIFDALAGNRSSDVMLAYLTGVTGAFVMLLGYMNNEPIFESIAPIIAITGAAPALVQLKKVPESDRTESTIVSTERDSEHGRLKAADRVSVAGQFDGEWFQMQLIPTYDDTNSVGNIYFANYVRWVGKAREQFFNACMPEFDLSKTTYYVLTRSFHHEFRREAKEFDNVLVRIRIAGNNRKFVTLRHEIVNASREILGRGEQSIMFLDSKSLQPLDIPRPIVEGFLPYWPRNSSFAVSGEAELVYSKTSSQAANRFDDSNTFSAGTGLLNK